MITIRDIFSVGVILSFSALNANALDEANQIGSDAQYNEDFAAVGDSQLALTEKEDAELEANFAKWLEQQGIPQVVDVQWNGGRRWRCFARNRRGTVFAGVSQSRRQAQRNAIWRCRNMSPSGCFVTSCR